MSVKLLRTYQGFAVNAIVTFPDATELALIAQGFATASTVTAEPSLLCGPNQTVTQGGNVAIVPQAGQGTPAFYQMPLSWPCIAMGSAALTTYEGIGVVTAAGAVVLTEIYSPNWQTWTGAGVLNGTIVGTDNFIVGIVGTNGAVLATSALAGTLSAGASVFQNIPFITAITLAPGRYFILLQSSGVTATVRHNLAANGAFNTCSTTAGVFGTIPATVVPPATFTTAVGVISQLYV